MSKLTNRDTSISTDDASETQMVTIGGTDSTAADGGENSSDGTDTAQNEEAEADSDGTAEVMDTEAVSAEPVPDPSDADNTWAMFLVNSMNPISEEYCDSIETAFVYSSWRDYYMDSRVSEYLKQMISDASNDGINLIIVSAYRTIDYQQRNFDNSVEDRMTNQGMTYEEAYADTLKEVQLPGYSEHNAGLAADIMSDECVDMDDDSFKNTEAYAWLQEHAADYGFILRYPEGKEDVTGIIYEPWHYRFVGVYYAKLLTDRGITMEEYFEEMNWVDENGVAVYHIPDAE
ncbi:MAG: M15 family metallopeptidase [Oscillospiraceae bacterium]|nr:M15 family metallopeptidase [Oscillospiraceae bacterium]